VFQFNHNVTANNVSRLRNADAPDRMLVTYGALAPLPAISRGPAIKSVGSPPRPDVGDSSHVAGLLLAWAAATNQHGVVLFSSTNAKHIRDNVRAFNKTHLDDAEVENLRQSLIRVL
jgi:diketogulonate reductase-like aldo/keto reductase